MHRLKISFFASHSNQKERDLGDNMNEMSVSSTTLQHKSMIGTYELSNESALTLNYRFPYSDAISFYTIMNTAIQSIFLLSIYICVPFNQNFQSEIVLSDSK